MVVNGGLEPEPLESSVLELELGLTKLHQHNMFLKNATANMSDMFFCFGGRNHP
jgi:hypothetical protein